MQSLNLGRLDSSRQASGAWAASLLHALAREESAGRRPLRLTEPDRTTWERFRGRLGAADLLMLLFEDAAVLSPVPFDAAALDGGLRPDRLPDDIVRGWLDALPALDLCADSAEYINAQARLLGLPTRLARSELHVVKPHQKVLELPGTGGQLAHHLLCAHSGLSLTDNFTVACGTWQEQTLAGIVALDLAAPGTAFAVAADTAALRDPAHPLRQRAFDFVIGLHPDKGGLLRAAEELAIWYSGARVLLV